MNTLRLTEMLYACFGAFAQVSHHLASWQRWEVGVAFVCSAVFGDNFILRD